MVHSDSNGYQMQRLNEQKNISKLLRFKKNQTNEINNFT